MMPHHLESNERSHCQPTDCYESVLNFLLMYPPPSFGLPNYGWINEALLLLLLLRQSHIGSIHCVGVVVDPRVNIRTLCVKLFCFFFVLPFLTLPQVLLPISVAPSLLFPFAGGNDVGLRGRCCWQAWEWVLLFHQRAIINENWSRFCE